MASDRFSTLSRRTVLALVGAGAVATAAAGAAATRVTRGLGVAPVGGPSPDGPMPTPTRAQPRVPQARNTQNPSRPGTIGTENSRAGTSDWRLGSAGHRKSDDHGHQVQGFASSTAVALGGSIDFFVTVNPVQNFRVRVFRLGWYNGEGARLMLTSGPIRGVTQPRHRIDADPDSRAVYCEWAKSWTLKVPTDWVSGVYLALLTNDRGFQHYVSFVVSDDRKADFLCVLPFATYQAYNLYPQDGVDGQSVYFGYGPDKKLDPYRRSTQVSFARPFAGSGATKLVDYEHNFVKWAEKHAYDVTYASSLDLHEGRVDPRKYRAIVIPGHDEYWSQNMRDVLDRAKAQGVHIASFGANQCYWRVRLATSPAKDLRLSVYKAKPDPAARSPRQAAKLWRDVGGSEQLLWGSCYGQAGAGVPKGGLPLVVKNADHWLWAGSGVTEDEHLVGAVMGEADHQVAGLALPKASEMVVLSDSTFTNTGGLDDRQQTVLYRSPAGGYVFNAGTFGWGVFLGAESDAAHKIQRATGNLFQRLLET